MKPIQRYLICMTLPLVVLLIAALVLGEGRFTYSLDDPYIHLALAKQIWSGHYGINPTEAAAPSSSILWPFLLAPFAMLGDAFQYVPLILNSIFLLLTALALHRAFVGQSEKVTLFVSFVLFLSMNLYGLVLTGMEHSLQLLLTVVIAQALWDRHRDGTPWMSGQFGRLATISLILLPLVRYEGLAITGSALLYLFLKGERVFAIKVGSVVAVLVGAFSVFLWTDGLGVLPTSVYAKSVLNGINAVWPMVLNNMLANWAIAVPLGFLIYRTWRGDRALVFVLIVLTLFHLVFGRSGWFGRYQVYYDLFVLVLFVRLYLDTRLFPLIGWVLLPLGFSTLTLTTVSTPMGCSNIQFQQGQMAELVKMLDEPVAVNDLGMVALESHHYVYDLFGLASREAIEARLRGNLSTEWLAQHMAAKHVRFAMIYQFWFPPMPPTWIKSGELVLMDELESPASNVVSFYATDAEADAKFRDVIVRYARAHPSFHYRFSVHR